MAKKKTDPDERPPPPVIGRTFQAHVNNTVLPGVYSTFCELVADDARADGKKRALSGASLEAHVQRRLEALPRGQISVRTARRWLKVCARAVGDRLTDCWAGPWFRVGVKGATGHVCRRA